MRLFVGLGNPGDRYVFNRHNVGFMLIDALFHYYEFPDFKQKFNGQITQSKIDNKTCLLFKPTTFMNISGKAVQQVIDFYKIPIEDVTVFHDDLDLLPFDIRMKNGGGAGGHNGLKSIDQFCTQNYWRYRFGIGHPGVKSMVSDYVLSNFSKNECEELSVFFEKFCHQISIFMDPKAGIVKYD